MENQENIYVKDFDGWNARKKDLNENMFDGFFYEREIWWASFGINIGSEQDGKGDSFERPIIIVKKINRDLLMATPLTSKLCSGIDNIKINIAGRESCVMISQLKVMSSKRLLRKFGQVKVTLFHRILVEMAMYIFESIRIEAPPDGEASRSPKAKVATL